MVVSVSSLPPYWPLYLAALLGAWLGCAIVFRRYFHPLSHVPGPFWYSVSTLPVLYHQAVREGKLIHVLPGLHEIYGPVVRIGPNEVHLNDPEQYEKIYSVGTKFAKDPSFYKPIDGPVKTPIILTVLGHDAHRIRRSALNPFFSRRSVLSLEDIIWDKAHKLCNIIQTGLQKEAGEPFDAHHAIRAFSVDVISEYAYARCWNQLDEKDFGAEYQEAIRSVQLMFIWFQTFPFLLPIFGMIPDWVNTILFPPFKQWYDSLVLVQDAVSEVRKEIEMDFKPPRRTIIHDLIDPPVEATGKERPRLSEMAVFADAVNVTGAGTETTGATAQRAIFEVISDPEIYATLRKELLDAFPNRDDMNYAALEKLPYLSGVVKEGLRLNPGVPGHLPRVVPTGGATFNSAHLPAGSVVSMSAWLMHQNAAVFPDPAKFDPTRWIGSSEDLRMRERCLVSFSRGSRNCIGQNLAMCELYCTLGLVFHRFDDLGVYQDFGREDLEMVELLIGYHPRKARQFKMVRRATPV